MKKLIFRLFALVALVAAGAAAVMLLWNALIPSIIGWNTITYLQALGILVLSRLLFGGFGSIRHRAKMHHFDSMSKAEKMAYIKERIAPHDKE